jgi:hypothetical protein
MTNRALTGFKRFLGTIRRQFGRAMLAKAFRGEVMGKSRDRTGGPMATEAPLAPRGSLERPPEPSSNHWLVDSWNPPAQKPISDVLDVGNGRLRPLFHFLCAACSAFTSSPRVRS